MLPSQVQHKKGDQWWPWTSGSVEGDTLREKLRISNGDSVYVNGCVVYALKFQNGSIWSVKGGWDEKTP